MRRWIAASVLASSLIAATVALAGESEKCTMSTQECLNAMAEKMKTAGFVGVELDKDTQGNDWAVKRVFENSPAEASGLQIGDILYALNGVVLNEANKDALSKARKEWQPGQVVTYTIRRNGVDREVKLTLAPVPADVMARWIGEHMLSHATAMDVAKTPVEPAKN